MRTCVDVRVRVVVSMDVRVDIRTCAHVCVRTCVRECIRVWMYLRVVIHPYAWGYMWRYMWKYVGLGVCGRVYITLVLMGLIEYGRRQTTCHSTEEFSKCDLPLHKKPNQIIHIYVCFY